MSKEGEKGLEPVSRPPSLAKEVLLTSFGLGLWGWT